MLFRTLDIIYLCQPGVTPKNTQTYAEIRADVAVHLFPLPLLWAWCQQDPSKGRGHKDGGPLGTGEKRWSLEGVGKVSTNHLGSRGPGRGSRGRRAAT